MRLDLREQHCELVAAEAADRVGRPDARAHRLHEPAQQRVAGGVPVVVVDLLEVVYVEQHDRALARVAARGADLGERPLLEAAPVQAARERIAREISISAARWRSWLPASHALITPVQANITANSAS